MCTLSGPFVSRLWSSMNSLYRRLITRFSGTRLLIFSRDNSSSTASLLCIGSPYNFLFICSFLASLLACFIAALWTSYHILMSYWRKKKEHSRLWITYKRRCFGKFPVKSSAQHGVYKSHNTTSCLNSMSCGCWLKRAPSLLYIALNTNPYDLYF